jgi:hypothetical protein
MRTRKRRTVIDGCVLAHWQLAGRINYDARTNAVHDQPKKVVIAAIDEAPPGHRIIEAHADALTPAVAKAS